MENMLPSRLRKKLVQSARRRYLIGFFDIKYVQLLFNIEILYKYYYLKSFYEDKEGRKKNDHVYLSYSHESIYCK